MGRLLFVALIGSVTAGCVDQRVSTGRVMADAFGHTARGKAVQRYTFANERGMVVSAISYGATITLIKIPDRGGAQDNIILSLPDVAAYEGSKRRWASIIGRYAGRIADAKISLDGAVYRLEPGRNGVTLHGGSNGYDRRIWKAAPFKDATSSGVVFRLSSPSGDQGFPGRLDVEVTYRLPKRANELRIEYRAKAAAATVFNPTNHGFFNLAGAGSGDIADHRVTIDADEYLETDERKIPTGKRKSVSGTALDLRRSIRLGSWLGARDPLLSPSDGYDHAFLLRGRNGKLRLAASVEEPVSGRRMEVLTTEPSIQFNTGNGFDGSETGSEGVAYRRYAGLALETQHLPDSPNRPEFPSTVVRPTREFRSTTIYRFSTTPASNTLGGAG